MSEENWRVPVDAGDYFGAQKKRMDMAQRRPAPRRLSDLVGPGIGANAVRIDDFNGDLAVFNGFFSAAAGTANAPTGDAAYVGFVASDLELGGVQTFTSLLTGDTYRRTFTRNVNDTNWVTWSSWALA